jgi:hypothetical protein
MRYHAVSQGKKGGLSVVGVGCCLTTAGVDGVGLTWANAVAARAKITARVWLFMSVGFPFDK